MPCVSHFVNLGSTSTQLGGYTPWTPWFMILPHSELEVTKQKKMGHLACPVLSTLDRRTRNSGATHHELHGLQSCHFQRLELPSKTKERLAHLVLSTLSLQRNCHPNWRPSTPGFKTTSQWEQELTRLKNGMCHVHPVSSTLTLPKWHYTCRILASRFPIMQHGRHNDRKRKNRTAKFDLAANHMPKATPCRANRLHSSKHVRSGRKPSWTAT